MHHSDTENCFAAGSETGERQIRQSPLIAGFFRVLQICYSTGSEPCQISLALIIPSPELSEEPPATPGVRADLGLSGMAAYPCKLDNVAYNLASKLVMGRNVLS